MSELLDLGVKIGGPIIGAVVGYGIARLQEWHKRSGEGRVAAATIVPVMMQIVDDLKDAFRQINEDQPDPTRQYSSQWEKDTLKLRRPLSMPEIQKAMPLMGRHPADAILKLQADLIAADEHMRVVWEHAPEDLDEDGLKQIGALILCAYDTLEVVARAGERTIPKGATVDWYRTWVKENPRGPLYPT